MAVTPSGPLWARTCSGSQSTCLGVQVLRHRAGQSSGFTRTRNTLIQSACTTHTVTSRVLERPLPCVLPRVTPGLWTIGPWDKLAGQGSPHQATHCSHLLLTSSWAAYLVKPFRQTFSPMRERNSSKAGPASSLLYISSSELWPALQ